MGEVVQMERKHRQDRNGSDGMSGAVLAILLELAIGAACAFGVWAYRLFW